MGGCDADLRGSESSTLESSTKRNRIPLSCPKVFKSPSARPPSRSCSPGMERASSTLRVFPSSTSRTWKNSTRTAPQMVGRAARVHGYVSAQSIERDLDEKRVSFAVQNDPPHGDTPVGPHSRRRLWKPRDAGPVPGRCGSRRRRPARDASGRAGLRSQQRDGQMSFEIRGPGRTGGGTERRALASHRFRRADRARAVGTDGPRQHCSSLPTPRPRSPVGPRAAGLEKTQSMADLGLYALRLSLLLCALGIGAGLYAGIAKRPNWTRVAERTLLLTCVATSVAMLALFWALASNDFSLSYVAQHSARTMPLHYRLGALWGGQAGSLLLWGWMLSVYGSVAVLGNRRQNRALMPWVCVAMLGNIAFFVFLTNFETPPFEHIAARSATLGWQRTEPAAPASSHVDSSRDALHGLHRLRPALLLRLRRARHRRARDDLVSNHATLDALRLERALHRRHAGRALGLRSARLGRLLGVGSSRECIDHALDRGYGLYPLSHDPGKARHAEDLEPRVDRPDLRSLPLRHLLDAQRDRPVGPRLCQLG